MDVLETATELYDLFGETGTCAVCQEDLQDGERVRSLKDCSHVFHQACIDPWFARKLECPMCRKSVGPAQPAAVDTATLEMHLANLQTIYTTLQGLLNGSMLPTTATNFQTLFTTVRAILNAAPIPITREDAVSGVNSMELRIRYALSFVLVDGILQRFATAAAYTPNRGQIASVIANFQVNGLRPLPIDTDTYAALVRSHEKLRDECKTRFSVGGNVRSLRACPHIRNWVTTLSTLPELQPIWTAPATGAP